MRIASPELFAAAVIGGLVGAVAVLAVLHQASAQTKRYLVILCTFLAGLFYVLEFFISPDPVAEDAVLLGWNLTQTASVVGKATQVITAFAFLLGVFNLVSIHGNHIRRRRPGWWNSGAFFAAFLAMLVFSFWKNWQTFFAGPPAPIWVNDTNPAHVLRPHDVYTFLFEGLWRNMEATMFSVLAFYIASAAYRAFRIRSGEAAVLMVVALILMMGQVPLGMVLTNWIPQESGLAVLRIENFSQYVLTTINAPAQRGIAFGLGLGSLAMALRIWLSLERGTYFQEE